MRSLTKIVMGVVEYYPEFKEKKFKTEFKDLGNYAARIFRDNGNYLLFVDNEFRKSRIFTLQGLSVHELEHFAIDTRLSEYNEEKIAKLYNHFEVYRQREEILVDLGVIFRGFGRQLLSYKRSLKNKGYSGNEGLSIEEIEFLLYPKNGNRILNHFRYA